MNKCLCIIKIIDLVIMIVFGFKIMICILVFCINIVLMFDDFKLWSSLLEWVFIVEYYIYCDLLFILF